MGITCPNCKREMRKKRKETGPRERLNTKTEHMSVTFFIVPRAKQITSSRTTDVELPEFKTAARIQTHSCVGGKHLH